MTLDHILLYLGILGYLIGACCYLLHLIGKARRLGPVATGATLAGFAAHSLSHLLRLYAVGRTDAVNPYASLSLFAWAIVLIYLVLEFRYQSRVLGAFVLPLAVLAASGAAAVPERVAALPPKLQGLGLSIHVALAIFGNAAFALTFCVGLMYLWQERLLKSRQPGRVRLPSLDLLDDVGVKSVMIGFPLLTLALISGSAWAEYARGSFLTFRHREVWSIASWFIYAGLLYFRVSAGWRGRKAAVLAILGFCFVLITFVGLKILRDGSLL